MWQIRIEDPSGERRTFPLQNSAILGRGNNCTVQLRDPIVAKEAALIWSAACPTDGALLEKRDSPFWIRLLEDSSTCRIGDLSVREAHLPPGLPVFMGETR